ncbi:unnamed protein product [Lathyrus sativus]|nr:unnamed protein product [Lathyrus sativus]CAK8072860.1 unnamed protein product [Lathyrus sativus]CAK8072861.1 unnamed protein product [Lathyrus sativus]
MAYVRLSLLAVLLLATFSMFSMKNVGATDCSGACSPFDMQPCRSTDCRCTAFTLFAGLCTNPSSPSVMKMIEEHPNLCQSHADCIKKKSGRFCARYPNPDIEHGWCFASNIEAQDIFFNISSNSEISKTYLKIHSST